MTALPMTGALEYAGCAGDSDDYAGADAVAGSAVASGIELCVGGPRASECPDGYRVTMEILEKVKELLDPAYRNKALVEMVRIDT